MIKKLCSYSVSLSCYSFSSDLVKLCSVWKKQCELYGTLKNVEDCVAKAKLLLEREDDDITKFVVKILTSIQHVGNMEAIELVIEIKCVFID